MIGAGAGGGKRGRKPAPGLESLDLSQSLSGDVIDQLTIPTLKAVCRHHGLKVTGSRPDLAARVHQHAQNPDDPALQKKKGGRAKRANKPPGGDPQHTHPVDHEVHADCPQCQAYGNPLAPEQVDEEFEVAPKPLEPVEAPQPAMELAVGDFEIAPAASPQDLAAAGGA